ncbi:PH-domain-containing protein [Aureobasidium sp. EXF-10727]|nr:PH-domain-containing protein [Aureobasidium sp. EXF-10727]KAI4728754.1 PH-domain-containing protein [Aureobasidium sp. EXF-10728]
MAAVMSQPPHHHHATPRPIDTQSTKINITPPNPQSLPSSVQNLRGGQLTLDTFSPVNQNGSFEFDRIIKAGQVSKRTRKIKSWKSIYIVLRPNLLSIYRDKTESNLRHQITLSDLTAIARQKDPKGKAKHVFALFSPSRNYHLEAASDQEAQDWVQLIRREARIDQNEEEIVLASPGGAKSTYRGFERHTDHTIDQDIPQGYSSSEADTPIYNPQTRRSRHALHSKRRPSHTLDYSGPENASYSDFSDSQGPSARMSSLSLTLAENQSQQMPASAGANAIYGANTRTPLAPRNVSQTSGIQTVKQDEERVICQGWIYMLKSKSGVRQWKKSWMVLRPKSLALYKNEEEYAAVLLIPFHNIIDAVEINPISKSKQFCMQLITEERNYRMCAPDDDGLARWLGGVKSLLAKRKEMAGGIQRAGTGAS